jgi:hypothetical protein
VISRCDIGDSRLLTLASSPGGDALALHWVTAW